MPDIFTDSRHRTSSVFPQVQPEGKGLVWLSAGKQISWTGDDVSVDTCSLIPHFCFPIPALEPTVECRAAVPAWAPTVLGHEIQPNPLL